MSDKAAPHFHQSSKFDADPQDQPWLWREAYLRDPDDNVMCLYHAGHNRQNPPWRINRPALTSDPIT